MEDQLIRAKGAGDDKLTNPHALHLRRRYGRTYYQVSEDPRASLDELHTSPISALSFRQFRPDTFYWQLTVLLRKAGIALCSLWFRRSPAFQLAALLFVLFVAYSAQVRVLPYMSPSEFDAVLANHAEAAYTSALHARLHATLAGIALRSRKRGRRNGLFELDGRIHFGNAIRFVGDALYNYNSVGRTTRVVAGRRFSIHVHVITHVPGRSNSPLRLHPRRARWNHVYSRAVIRLLHVVLRCHHGDPPAADCLLHNLLCGRLAEERAGQESRARDDELVLALAARRSCRGNRSRDMEQVRRRSKGCRDTQGDFRTLFAHVAEGLPCCCWQEL